MKKAHRQKPTVRSSSQKAAGIPILPLRLAIGSGSAGALLLGPVRSVARVSPVRRASSFRPLRCADVLVQKDADAVQHVRDNPEPEKVGGMAPMYGMAGTLPVRTLVSELLQRYIDMLYKV